MEILNPSLVGNVFIETFFIVFFVCFFFFTGAAALLFHITDAKELNHVLLVKGNGMQK